MAYTPLVPRTAARRLHAGGAAARGRARLFGLEHRAPRRARAAARCTTLRRRRAPAARSSSASARSSASRSRWRCSTTRSSSADYARVHRSFKQLADELVAAAARRGAARGAQAHRRAGAGPLRPAHRARCRGARATRGADRAASTASSPRARAKCSRSTTASPTARCERLRAQRRERCSAAHPAGALRHRGRARPSRSRSRATSRGRSRRSTRAIRQLGGADFARADRGARARRTCSYLGERLDWLRRRLAEFEAAEEPLPAPRLARAEDAAHRAARGRRAAATTRSAARSRRRSARWSSIMRDNSVKLQRLIEELLDYQRALHAAASLELKPVSLDALVARGGALARARRAVEGPAPDARRAGGDARGRSARSCARSSTTWSATRSSSPRRAGRSRCSARAQRRAMP